MELTQVVVQVVEIVAPVVATLLVVLLGYAIAFIRKQTAKLGNDLARDAILAALVEAEKVATDAINATNQKFVADIKAANADGKLTKEEAQQAMGMAVDYFIQNMTTRGLSVLEAAIGPVEAWLKDFLEAKIAERKTPVAARVARIADPS